ncbi:MAG: LiaF domain-containing protein [Gemmatimonadaceae bacterium]
MTLPAHTDRHTVVPAHQVKERAGILAVMSGQERRGNWELPRYMRIACVLGSTELDLREARIPEGESVIEVFCLLGSVELMVPSGVFVEMDGDAFAGSFSNSPDQTIEPLPGAPRIRLKGTAYFGSVECEARLAGEGKRAAQRRIKASRTNRLKPG